MASRGVVAFLLLSVAACDSAGPVDPSWFTVRNAVDTGIDFVHESGATGDFLFPEIMSSGVCLLDYDADGLLDIYFVQGGTVDAAAAATEPPESNRLYNNRGGRRFEDRTAEAGVGDTSYGLGCATGDFDSDGWIDLYVTNLGRNTLYRNRGDGTFIDITEPSGAGIEGWSAGAGFGDFNGDNRLDLFVVNYIDWAPHREIECHERGRRDYCSPNNYSAPSRDHLLLGDGLGGFEDVGDAWGLGSAFGNGLGLGLADFDLDGDLDAFVANDAMANQLWINQGGAGLRDQALVLGAAFNFAGVAEAGMGVAVGDIDADGDEDLFLAHLDEETNTLYLNSDGVFADLTARSGLGPSSRGRTGFGTGLADFDNDGAPDLFVANGRVKHGQGADGSQQDPYAEPNLLLRGTRGGRFEAMPRAGLAAPLVATSRGAAIGDLDNDGSLDLVVSNRDQVPHVLYNRIGAARGWIMLRVLNGKSDAVGARVEVEALGTSQWRTVSTTASYCSANDSRLHFGLGAATRADRVVVHWMDGTQEAFGPLSANLLHRLERGQGRGAP